MAEPSNDVVGIVLTLINDNWNTDNCAKPTIDRVENVKRIDARGNGYILLYESGGLAKSRGDVQWDSRNWNAQVAVDIRTTVDVDRLNAIYDELDRIFTLFRRDVTGTGWHRIEESNRLNLTNKAVGLWRYVVHMNLIARQKFVRP